MKAEILKAAGFGADALARKLNETARVASILTALADAAEILADGAALVQHIQDLDCLTQGGSTEGWANRWLGQVAPSLARLREVIK